MLADGLARSEPVLDALEAIAADGLVLTGADLTLADLHLAPMIGFFVSAPEGAAALARRPALSRWFRTISALPAYRVTCPPLVSTAQGI